MRKALSIPSAFGQDIAGYCIPYVEEQAFQACVKTQNKRGFQPRCLRDTPTLQML
jgi:hypothetical protein